MENPSGITDCVIFYTFKPVKESNMLYVESPIGVGFSYSNKSEDYINWNDTRTGMHHSINCLWTLFKPLRNLLICNDFLIGYSWGESEIHVKLVGRVSPIQILRLLFNWGELCRLLKALTLRHLYHLFNCKNLRWEFGLLGIPDFHQKSAENIIFKGRIPKATEFWYSVWWVTGMQSSYKAANTNSPNNSCNLAR